MAEARVFDEDSAWALVRDLVADPGLQPEPGWFDLSNWPILDIYIADAVPDGAVTAPMLEAALGIQRSVYRLAAFVKYNEANGQLLTDKDREEFLIRFVVKAGSSDIKAYLKDGLLELIKQSVNKMTGRELATVIVLLGGMAAGYLGWVHYLNTNLEVKKLELEGHRSELATKEKEALADVAKDAIALARQRMADLEKLANESIIGKKTKETASEIQDHVARGVDAVGGARVSGLEISGAAANIVRKNPRRKKSIITIEQEYIVVKIDRTDQQIVRVVLEDPDTGEQISVPFSDPLVQEQHLKLVGLAAGMRRMVRAKISVQKFGDEVRGQELVQVSEPESDTNSLADGSIRPADGGD